MITIIKDIWEDTRPKIFEVAKNEQSSALKALYEESTSCVSEGSYISQPKVPVHKMYTYSFSRKQSIICSDDACAFAPRYSHCNEYKQNCYFY